MKIVVAHHGDITSVQPFATAKHQLSRPSNTGSFMHTWPKLEKSATSRSVPELGSVLILQPPSYTDRQRSSIIKLTLLNFCYRLPAITDNVECNCFNHFFVHWPLYAMFLGEQEESPVPQYCMLWSQDKAILIHICVCNLDVTFLKKMG